MSWLESSSISVPRKILVRNPIRADAGKDGMVGVGGLEDACFPGVSVLFPWADELSD